MPNTPFASPRKIRITNPTHHLITRNPPNDSSPLRPMHLRLIPNNPRSEARLFHTLLPLDPPLIHAALYPRRNKNAASPSNSTCIVAIRIMRFRIAHVFKALRKRVTTNNALTFTLYLLLLLPLLRLHPLPSLSSPLRETPHLRAPSDGISEGYYLGYFVYFIA